MTVGGMGFIPERLLMMMMMCACIIYTYAYVRHNKYQYILPYIVYTYINQYRYTHIWYRQTI